MSERPARPSRADYVRWERVTTRWADIDVYGHMNNARYFELIDTVVNNHLAEATAVDIRDLPAIGVVAEVGRSSVVYRVGLFQGDADEAAAEGRFVHVYVDNTDPARPVTPMPDV